jgi:hypothetical protein
LQEINYPVFDEKSSREYEDHFEERLKYFRAKLEYHLQTLYER